MVRLGQPAGDRPPSPSTRPARSSLALSLVLHGLIGLPLLAAGATGSASSEAPALIVDVAMASAASSAAADASAAATEPTTQPTTNRPDVPLPPPEEPPPIDTSTMTTPSERETKTVERETRIDLTPPEEPPPLDTATLKVEREIKIDLAPAEEPPPLDASTLKPVEQAKPKPAPAPKPAPPSQAAKADSPRPAAPAAPRSADKPAAPAGAASSNFGSANDAQQAAAGFLPAPAIVWEGKPRFRHPPTPAAYPPRAIELNQQGEALVRVRLDTAGTAVEIVLHRSSGHHALDSAALAAVRSWHFLPAMRDGRPVPSWVEIPVRFHLR
jgi:protein TonB